MKQSNAIKWYGKFIRVKGVSRKKEKGVQENEKIPQKKKIREEQKVTINKKIDAQIFLHKKLFTFHNDEARKIINSFDEIVQDVFPIKSRQQQTLLQEVRRLSHELTDERSERRLSYMNTPVVLSAYVRYFCWWNIIRFTRLFSNCDFSLVDGDSCIDVGSGPLTAVISLWLSHPELRNKKLTWYCMDISQNALSLGEDLYLSIASRTPPTDENAAAHWNIVRVKGAFGTSIKQKAALTICANMVNELYDANSASDEAFAEKFATAILSYASETGAVFVIEPGVPQNAHIISLLRAQFLKSGLVIISPCPHEQKCAMDGYHAKRGGKAKWCNFAFSTENVPLALQKFSTDAGIPKERAVVSFIFAKRNGASKNEQHCTKQKHLALRIASHTIFLPNHQTGFYACSECGLTLVVNSSSVKIASGDSLLVKPLRALKNLSHDKKTNAVVLTI